MKCDALIGDFIGSTYRSGPGVVIVVLPEQERAVGFYAAAYIDHAGRAKIRPGKFLFASPNEFDWFGCGLRKTRCFDRYLTRMFASVG